MKATKILILALFVGVCCNVANIMCAAPSKETTSPTKDELAMMSKLCTDLDFGDKEECQALIEANVLPSLQSCVVSCNSIGEEDTSCYKSCNQIGIVYLIAGNYNKSIEYAKQSIKLGNPYPVGWLDSLHYRSGNMEALQIVEKFCATNKDKKLQAASCVILGRIYLKGSGIFGAGKGVGQNYKKAFDYSKKSCDMGDIAGLSPQIGCYIVGYLYFHGKGIRQDISQAKEYFGKSCDFGYQGACERYKKMQ